jgi:hypothetical protein
MELHEESRYLTIYEDENCTIWIDAEEQTVSIFLEEGGQRLDLTYEDFDNFREAINSIETLP